MKTRLSLLSIALLVAALVCVTPPAQASVSAQGQGFTAPWHHVAAACVPDDSTLSSDYNATDGRVEFKGTRTGDLYFWCNVVNPHDLDGTNPNWGAMQITYVDPGGSSQVSVKLYRKRLDTGAIGVNATFDSNCAGCTQSGTIQRRYVLLDSGFDFQTYAYYVLIRLNRSSTTVQPQAHIVSLTYTPPF